MFEGEIKYKLIFSPEEARIDTISLKDYYGKQWTFLFKNGNFRWNMETSDTWIGNVYNREENKFYYLMKDTDVVSWKRGAQQTDSIISIKLADSRTIVLGYHCKVLEVKSKLLINNMLRTRHYYYSPEIRVKPEWFAGNEDGNYNEIFSRIKAIPLKIEDNFGAFKITYEAFNITSKRLDNSVFDIKASHLMELK